MIEEIKYNDELLAIIIRQNFNKPGIEFFTPSHFSQQLAFMKHPAGHVIKAHVHNDVVREIHYTKEVLFLRKGKLRVDFYSNQKKYVESCIISGGDVLFLADGGHGFEVLEEIEMIEVKQGPFTGDNDKTVFKGVNLEEIIIKARS